MMGIFAFYCGLIYNEWFAIPTNIFGSCYELNKTENLDPEPVTPTNKLIYRRLRKEPNTDLTCVYPFGLDPAWSIA